MSAAMRRTVTSGVLTDALPTDNEPRLWWDQSGAGDPPLLLIQGLGYTADMWHSVLPALSASRRVVRFDNRGVGRSDVPDGEWSMEGMADDAVRVLDAAGVESAYVFGVSMGGVIAQEVALRHRDRVRGLILGGTHPSGRDAVRASPEAVAMLFDRTPRTPREAIEASLPFVYADDTPRDRIEADVAVRLRWPLRAKAYWGQLDAMRQHGGLLARLRGLDVPALVMHGTADRLVQPENARLLAEAIPGARLAWLDGASHIFWTERPEETVRLVDEFVAELA
jgi:pimeloyl-ACP methyl ester carboxylesterase